MAQFFWYALTSSNINRFSKLFHFQNQEKICSNTITKDPTTPEVTVTSCRCSAGISCTDVCGKTARHHTLPGTHWRTCGVRTSRSSSLTCGTQTARTWIQSIALLGVPFNRWFINVDNSQQSTSWSTQSSLSGTNYCSVSSIAPLVSGVAGLTGSSRSKANKLNIWYKKLIRRWDSERELSLRRHCTRTKNTIDSCINCATDRFLQRRFTKFIEITQCNGHYAVQGHSRSPILVPIES